LQLIVYICFIEVKIKIEMYTGTLVEFLNMGGGEIMLIMVVVLLLFGGKKLPELARGLGKGLRDFKDASEGVKREIHRNINSAGITDEINEFKSTFNADDTGNRPHNYDYKPGEDMYSSDSHDGNPGYNDESAHYNSTLDSDHSVNAESATNESVENNTNGIEPAEDVENVKHVAHSEHTKTETDKN
jgi:sec-independent protein translocase protein TatA